MRILYLTGGFPYPLTSGYLRHYFLLRELSHEHRITLLSLVGPSFIPEHEAALRPFTQRVVTFPLRSQDRTSVGKALSRLRFARKTEPTMMAMRRAVAQVEGEADVVVSGKRTLSALMPVNGKPVVADMCDASSMRIRRSLRHADPVALPVAMIEYRQTQRAEHALLRRAAHSVFISCRDREDLLGTSTAATSIVPNGIDLGYWRRTTAMRGQDTIVFTGAMSYRPNADAALLLIERIFPLVRQARPRAKLLIVGRDPTVALVEAGRRAGVTVTGSVPDVRPYLERATVFAAPIRFGAGMQNKVLEALAMEVPVVASSLAADGLRTEEGRSPPVEVADDPARFAQRLLDRLAEDDLNRAPDAAARHFVEQNFVWATSAASLDRVLDEVARKP